MKGLNIIRYNPKSEMEFVKELTKRVNGYFKENNISKFADGRMVFKTVFMLSLYFVPFLLVLTGILSGTWAVLAMYALMGFGMSGIGLSIMHDANHGAYSKNQKVNKLMGATINLVGGML